MNLPKPPLLLDVDGVLGDFSNHLLRSVGSKLTLADVTQWDIFALLEPEGLKGAALDLLKDPAWWARMPTMPGVEDLIDALLAEEAEVVCATSPWLSCVGWETARRDWIRKVWMECGASRSQVPEAIVAGAKHHVRGAVLVDDKPEHVESWARVNPGRTAYLFDAPYNQAAVDPGFRRLLGWNVETIGEVISLYNRQGEPRSSAA